MRIHLVVLPCLIPALLWSQGPGSLGKPVQVIESIPGPESVAIGPDGAWYVSAFGEFGKGADGAIYRVDPDKGAPEIYARGLEDPCGVLFVGSTLWVADRKGVYRITRGKPELVYAAEEFPRPLHFLNDLAAANGGGLYVSDTGDSTTGGHGAVFRLTPGKRPSVVPGSDTVRSQSSVNGLFAGGGDTLYMVGFRTGVLSVTDGKGRWRDLARGLGAPDGIDTAGKDAFYISDNAGGDLFLVQRSRPSTPRTLVSGLDSPADLVIDHKRGLLIVPENSGNRLSIWKLDQHASK